ncbi:MAG: hypothetical protein ABI947_07240 [Chloroflexota bacterium]
MNTTKAVKQSKKLVTNFLAKPRLSAKKMQQTVEAMTHTATHRAQKRRAALRRRASLFGIALIGTLVLILRRSMPTVQPESVPVTKDF